MSDPTTRTDSAFWRFSLAFYAGSGIPEACLTLQDDCGVDVNVLLYVLFLARAGRQLADEDVARIDALCAQWRDNVVRPLRQARRFTKMPPAPFDGPDAQALRTELKRIELEAEYLQQIALERGLPTLGLGAYNTDVEACARHNLAAYAKHIGPLAPTPVDRLVRRAISL